MTLPSPFRSQPDRRRVLALGGGMLGAALLGGRRASAQEIGLFRIGTGGVAGTYYPIGALVANIISNPPGGRSCEDGGSCGVPGLIAVAQSSAGSLENLARIADGSLEGGLAQSDMAYAAYTGTGLFEGLPPAEDLRVIASLYLESMHVVARADLDVENIADLKGKRVSVDVANSGTQADALLVLDAYGLDPDDLDLVEVGGTEAATMLREGELDAFFYLAGWPALLVSELAAEGLVQLLPVNGDTQARLVVDHPLFTFDLIPFGTYKNISAIETVGVTAQFLTSVQLDNDLIYGITRALWHPSSRLLLDQGHVKARDITLDTAVETHGVPLHAGAERYYRDAEVIGEP